MSASLGNDHGDDRDDPQSESPVPSTLPEGQSVDLAAEAKAGIV